MTDKNNFVDFLRRYFSSKTIKVKHFDSGCSMVDIFLDEKDVLCVQIEPSQIGISIIEDFINYFDLRNTSDNVFYSNMDAETFVLNMTVKRCVKLNLGPIINSYIHPNPVS